MTENVYRTLVPDHLIREVNAFRSDLKGKIEGMGQELDISKDLHPIVKELLSKANPLSDTYQKLKHENKFTRKEIESFFVTLAKGFQYVEDIFGMGVVKLSIGHKFSDRDGNISTDTCQIRPTHENDSVFELTNTRIKNFINKVNLNKSLISYFGTKHKALDKLFLIGVHEGFHAHQNFREKTTGISTKDIMGGENLSDSPYIKGIREVYLKAYSKKTIEKDIKNYTTNPKEVEVALAEYEAAEIMGIKVNYVKVEKPAQPAITESTKSLV